MAIIYRVREGSGEGAIASRDIVHLADVVARFPNVRAKYSARMPLIGSGPANAVAEPRVMVVQVIASDSSVAPFVKVGYFLLENVHPRDARNWTQ